MTTDRAGRHVDTNSRIVLTGGAVGLGLGLIGAMAWADGSAAPVDSTGEAVPAALHTTSERIIVIVPESTMSRAELPAAAAPSSDRSLRAPVSRSQGS